MVVEKIRLVNIFPSNTTKKNRYSVKKYIKLLHEPRVIFDVH